MTVRRRVWVTHRFIGFHQWDDAPERRAYLREPHRHVFHVRACVDVNHEGREIEFHDMLAVVTKLCDDMTAVGSCETIATVLAEWLGDEYPGRRIGVEVSEDGENGALVELEPM